MKRLKLLPMLLALVLLLAACANTTATQKPQEANPSPGTTTVSEAPSTTAPTESAPNVSVSEPDASAVASQNPPEIQLVKLVVKNGVTLAVDEKEATFPVDTPFIGADWSKMSPAKFIGSSLGAEMTWDAKAKTLTFHKSWDLPPGKYESIVTLTVGSSDYSVRVKGPGLDATQPMTIGAEETSVADAWLYVPARHLAEALSAKATYDAVARTITITSVKPEYTVGGAESAEPSGSASSPTETTPTASQPPASSKPAETPKPEIPAVSTHAFDMNDPNVQKHKIYATAKTAKELVEANPSGVSGAWQFTTEKIAAMKDKDNIVPADLAGKEGVTFYDWRMPPIIDWVNRYLKDNGLSIANKTDYEKTAVIRHIVENGRFEEFIGLWRPGFVFTSGDCVPRAEALNFLMMAMDFELFASLNCTWGEAHATNAYWDSTTGAVRFIDAFNLSSWNCYVDELDEWNFVLD